MAAWFAFGFPLFMLVSPVLFIALWCYLTGVWDLRRMLLATGVVLALYGGGVALLGTDVARQQWFWQPFAMGGFFVLIFGFGVPVVRRAYAALPEAPRVVSLQTRRVELFRGAMVWPFVAWLLLTASLLLAPQRHWTIWLGPALGLVGLALLRVVLPSMVSEPEPGGGADPAGLARRQAKFRRRRTRTMYWMMVVLNLAFLNSNHLAWLGKRSLQLAEAIWQPVLQRR